MGNERDSKSRAIEILLRFATFIYAIYALSFSRNGITAQFRDLRRGFFFPLQRDAMFVAIIHKSQLNRRNE